MILSLSCNDVVINGAGNKGSNIFNIGSSEIRIPIDFLLSKGLGSFLLPGMIKVYGPGKVLFNNLKVEESNC